MRDRAASALAVLGLAGLLAGAGRGSAEEAPAPAQGPSAGTQGPAAERFSVTTGTLAPAGGQPLTYTATAGTLPLKSEQGKLRAGLFYVAYTLASPHEKPAPPETLRRRPVTFVFNGGPGAASVWLHLGAVGPRRLDVPPDGSGPKPPFRVVENEYSWLPATDLVFIDPVNTGYSRAATPEQAKEFFGVQEDISAVGEFVRLYLTRNQRWGSPVFLAGESYGTTRAAGLAEYLQDRLGVSVSGVVLLSTVLNFALLSPGESNDLPYALYLPSYAAAAWYHGRLGSQSKELDPLLKEAERFALGEYLTALARGAALPDAERQGVAKRMAELTGLPAAYILASNLRVPPHRFEKELLRGTPGAGQVIGRFDARVTGASTDPGNDSAEYDPSLSGFYPAYTSAFNEYARRDLKYESDLQYEVLSGRVQPWNFGGGNGYLYVGDNLRDAMTKNPHLRLLVCSGHYDLATPYFATDYTLGHLNLAPHLRKNVTHRYYAGGHMMYHVKPALEKLFGDVMAFYAAAEQ